MNPEIATSWLKFLRELSATILIWAFATYSGYALIRDSEIWNPRIANAIDTHVLNAAAANAAVVTNTEELTRLARLQCQSLRVFVKQDPAACEIRNIRLGSTIVP